MIIILLWDAQTEVLNWKGAMSFVEVMNSKMSYETLIIDPYIWFKMYFFWDLFHSCIKCNLLYFYYSLGLCEVPHKIWAQSVQPFWRFKDTSRHKNRQTSTKYINRCLRSLTSSWEDILYFQNNNNCLKI